MKTEPLNKVEIIADNLINNFQTLRNNKNGIDVFPVLKSNAYGHGLEECVKILESQKPSYLAVVTYEEALRIREISRLPVLIIGPVHPNNVKTILKKKFTLAVTNERVLEEVVNLKKRVKIHIFFNTGMNREGFIKKDISKIVEVLKQNSQIECEGLMSHLADADGQNDDYVKFQENNFSEILDILFENDIKPRWIHLGNSAYFGRLKDNRINAFRPGLALYGYSPTNSVDLKPILRFVTTVTDIQELNQGDKVSYNCTFEAPKKMKIATLPVGYYELLDRKLSNQGWMKFKNDFLPIVGRVCMNLTMIDTKDHDIETGDEVVVISEIPADKNSALNIAKLIDTIPYEVLTRVIRDHSRVIV